MIQAIRPQYPALPVWRSSAVRPFRAPELLFGVNAENSKTYHRSDKEGDDYRRYNPANTNLPLAVFHTIASPDAHATHERLSRQLAMHIAGRGHMMLGIPWIAQRKPMSELDYTVFDVETTGLEQNARIIQLAASPVSKGHQVDYSASMEQKFNPGLVEGSKRPFVIAPEATAIHGITTEEVQDKPQLSEWLSKLRGNTQDSLLGQKRLMVAYNAKFDVGRMNEAIRLYNQTSAKKLPEIPLELVVDPFILIQRIHPFNSQKKTLGMVYKILMGCELENKHDAQADVDATVDVLKYILKNLQKHAIPVQWCRLAEALLTEESKQGRLKDDAGKPVHWESLATAQKAGLIAGYIARERKFFEKRFPEYEAKPIRAIDVLNFQFGSLAVHDGLIQHYPVFDITLDKFGLDSSKYWDGTDRLDLNLVREVRQEREQENLQYLVKLFSQGFPDFPLTALIKDFRKFVKPGLENADEIQQFERQLKQEILGTVGKRIAYKLLKRGQPVANPEESNRQFLKEVQETNLELVKALLDKKIRKYAANPDDPQVMPELEKYYQPLVQQIQQHAEQMLNLLGNRYLYSYIDADMGDAKTNGDILIDPAVLTSYSYALRKAEHNHPLLYQNPNAAIRQKPPTEPGIEGQATTPVESFPVQKGIMVQQPWLDKILDGKKTWEIRGTNTYHRGWIALAESGNKNDDKGVRMIRGVAYLDDVKGPLSNQEIYGNVRKHQIPKAFLDFYNGVRYKKPYAWILSHVKRLDVPVPVAIKQGQIVWFNLPEKAQQALNKFLPPEVKQGQAKPR